MSLYDIKDCHFSFLTVSNMVILSISATSKETVSLRYSSFSSSKCQNLAFISNVLSTYVKSVTFFNNTVDIPWQFYNVYSIQYISDVLSKTRTSSSLYGLETDYFCHSNLSQITASTLRTAICFEKAENSIADYIAVDSCNGPPLVGFHTATKASSLSHFIFYGGKTTGALFAFEVSKATVTFSDSIFIGVQATSILTQLSGSSSCQVLFSECHSNITIVSDQNSDLLFGIDFGPQYLYWECLTCNVHIAMSVLVLDLFFVLIE